MSGFARITQEVTQALATGSGAHARITQEVVQALGEPGPKSKVRITQLTTQALVAVAPGDSRVTQLMVQDLGVPGTPPPPASEADDTDEQWFNVFN